METTPSPATILIVDDVPLNISLLNAALLNEYRVKVSTGGKQAIDICLSVPIDLILLDVMMPEMDGFETCRRLKEHPRTSKIPVIFVTARGQAVDESMGFSCGAVDYINKPVCSSSMRARVKTHLALYHQNRTLEKIVRDRTAEIRQINESLEQQVAARIEELQRSTAVAKAANSAKSRFLANMNHELNSIIGFTDVVLTRNTMIIFVTIKSKSVDIYCQAASDEGDIACCFDTVYPKEELFGITYDKFVAHGNGKMEINNP
ncbi:MAG: response regulator [Desulfuromonadaceae bacterium]